MDHWDNFKNSYVEPGDKTIGHLINIWDIGLEDTLSIFEYT